ncbi:replication-relaxation family protein [Desulfitibacter alkalitolerans]|uniref:replication-relaxation family protein n=1 Tax=Desulfitibacter alkalitolerans TaxID=264641 RepID=UPI0006860A6E|nr:replication-relaxation family protein [Desulfitibacter alkalitolerans]
MLTNHKKGYLRDRRILEAINKHGVLDTDQIEVLFFNGIKNSKRIAQKRLLKLYETKKIKRGRDIPGAPFYYYSGKKSDQLDHLLSVNWVYIWTMANLRSWEQLLSFEYEQDYRILRCDCFVGISNAVTKENKFYFVEVDLGSNPFDKVSKYNNLYQSGEYSGAWWVPKTNRFPAILVVTNSKNRKTNIEELIKKENTNNLEFNVKLLEDIKSEVGGWNRALAF